MTHDAKIEEKGIKSKPYFCKDKAYFCKDEPLIFISAPKPKKRSRSKRKNGKPAFSFMTRKTPVPASGKSAGQGVGKTEAGRQIRPLRRHASLPENPSPAQPQKTVSTSVKTKVLTVFSKVLRVFTEVLTVNPGTGKNRTHCKSAQRNSGTAGHSGRSIHQTVTSTLPPAFTEMHFRRSGRERLNGSFRA